MNKKITIRIVLIIIAFLILSSSLFAPIYPDELLDGLDELGEAIIMFFLMVIIILILIIAGVVNYSYNKEKEEEKEKYRDYYSLMNASDNEELKRLLENGIDINAKDGDGWTALMDASNKGNLEIAKYLLENGADINFQSNYGFTALISASSKGNIEMVKLLVENEADVNIKNNYGKTALDLAKIEEIKELLRKAGAK